MKLCLIAPEAPPYGGITNWTNIIFRQIEKRQKDIDVSFINIAPTVSFMERKTFFSRICCGVLELLRQQKELKSEMKLCRPDIVHLTTSGRLAFIRDYSLMRIIRKNNIPCIYHLHFGRIPEIVERRSWEYILFSRNVSKASKVIAIDQKTYECLQVEFGKEKIVYIPNPVEVLEDTAIKTNDKKEILFVGWVIKEKGIEELLEAWSKLKYDFPTHSLHIVGPYNEEYYKYLCSTYNMANVIMEGELTHAQTLKRIQECTLLVLPSYSEGCPNVILEAMMAKKSIIAARVGAIPEMLSADSGIIIEPQSSEQVRIALNQLLQNTSHQKILSKNAYKRVMERYEVGIVFKQYLKLWELQK